MYGEFELPRPQHRQVGWPHAVENSTGVDPALAIGLREAWSIAHQATCVDEHALRVDRGDRVARCQSDDLLTTAHEERIVGDEESVRPLLDKARPGRVDLTFCAGVQDADLPSHQASRLL